MDVGGCVIGLLLLLFFGGLFIGMLYFLFTGQFIPAIACGVVLMLFK
jgi:hypothetical protein